MALLARAELRDSRAFTCNRHVPPLNFHEHVVQANQKAECLLKSKWDMTYLYDVEFFRLGIECILDVTLSNDPKVLNNFDSSRSQQIIFSICKCL